MKIAALIVLAAALAACGHKEAPPTAPTPEAVGTELATFAQVLAPISTQTWTSMQAAAANGDAERSLATAYAQPYAHAAAQVNGRGASVLVAYTSVFLVPAGVPLQPMSVQQYLTAFSADAGADLASVVSPKGNIFFTRDQLPDVIVAASKAGAGFASLPYSVVLGTGR